MKNTGCKKDGLFSKVNRAINETVEPPKPYKEVIDDHGSYLRFYNPQDYRLFLEQREINRLSD
jgi:hypothetical protein